MAEYEDANKDGLIAGLLRELVGYEAREDEANIKGVKEELARLGWKPAAPAKRAETRPAKAAEKR
jgi:hypothetical protein